jgi:hypothetical protein
MIIGDARLDLRSVVGTNGITRRIGTGRLSGGERDDPSGTGTTNSHHPKLHKGDRYSGSVRPALLACDAVMKRSGSTKREPIGRAGTEKNSSASRVVVADDVADSELMQVPRRLIRRPAAADATTRGSGRRELGVLANRAVPKRGKYTRVQHLQPGRWAFQLDTYICVVYQGRSHLFGALFLIWAFLHRYHELLSSACSAPQTLPAKP